ncbi:Gfo/Idh/MocA family oxidoreductase [Sphingomonas sp. MG17]|uniref:Gfo/Idh/MocA family oxidoreductase n=1 Tax=Sphingomonas tagetis TaxID=2949092 RepID=A0A9X2KLE9_9SPHN|nr:Gfo/Idh/MocA family oxidoreductase [Sphingomonas tagetis]MCP3730331.1 Gfo/Idh/MocA family oxidoreductase [Sphingomonas tagetis]
MADRIRVGLVGANPDPVKSWGTRAHIPALKHLPDYELVALCTSNPASARAAAEHFAVPLAFSDPREMAAHGSVDLVAISVRTPLHRSLVQATLAEGKHVYCEWPLGVTTEEALATLAETEAAGVQSVIGLQGRFNETLNYAADLIAGGFVGKLTAVTMEVEQENFGPVETSANAYTADVANGANLLRIATAQALSGMCHAVGNFGELSATVSCQHQQARIIETGEIIPKSSPDQIIINGTLENGAVASVHIKGGATRTAGVRLEINGREGDLLLTSEGGANVHRAILRMAGGRDGQLDPMALPVRYALEPAGLGPGPALGIAHLYRDFATHLRSGQPSPLNFRHAVRWQQLIDAIQLASDTGQRQNLGVPAAVSA